MKGNVTVYNFIFTNCAGTCPIMTNNMRAVTPKIDRRRPGPLRLHQRRSGPRHPGRPRRLRQTRPQRPPLDLPHRRPDAIVDLSVKASNSPPATPPPEASRSSTAPNSPSPTRKAYPRVLRRHRRRRPGHVAATVHELLRE